MICKAFHTPYFAANLNMQQRKNLEKKNKSETVFCLTENNRKVDGAA